MPATSTLTQTGLRLELVSLEIQSLLDRILKDERLRQIVEYCVPRRLLRTIFVIAKHHCDTVMRMQLEIDYAEHDRQIRVSGDGLPDGIAGRYTIGDASVEAGSGATVNRPSCPHVGKAIDVFAKIARDRKLYVSWDVSFVDRHEELHKKFGLPFSRDLTYTGHRAEVTDSLFSELKLVAAVAPDIVKSFETGRNNRPPQTTKTQDDERK